MCFLLLFLFVDDAALVANKVYIQPIHKYVITFNSGIQQQQQRNCIVNLERDG